MRSVQLLAFLTLFAAALALLPLSAPPRPAPDLTGRWRVESVLVDGRQSLRPEVEDVVFKAKTAEYLSTTPVVAPTPSHS